MIDTLVNEINEYKEINSNLKYYIRSKEHRSKINIEDLDYLVSTSSNSWELLNTYVELCEELKTLKQESIFLATRLNTLKQQDTIELCCIQITEKIPEIKVFNWDDIFNKFRDNPRPKIGTGKVSNGISKALKETGNLPIEKGNVYLIYSDSIRNVEGQKGYKIGMTINLTTRFKDLNRKYGNFDIVEVIRTQDMRNLELKLHNKFAHKNMWAEWFNLDNNDVMEIRNISFAESI